MMQSIAEETERQSAQKDSHFLSTSTLHSSGDDEEEAEDTLNSMMSSTSLSARSAPLYSAERDSELHAMPSIMYASTGHLNIPPPQKAGRTISTKTRLKRQGFVSLKPGESSSGFVVKSIRRGTAEWRGLIKPFGMYCRAPCVRYTIATITWPNTFCFLSYGSGRPGLSVSRQATFL